MLGILKKYTVEFFDMEEPTPLTSAQVGVILRRDHAENNERMYIALMELQKSKNITISYIKINISLPHLKVRQYT
jgi:hypothetical protein